MLVLVKECENVKLAVLFHDRRGWVIDIGLYVRRKPYVSVSYDCRPAQEVEAVDITCWGFLPVRMRKTVRTQSLKS
jgi:hypothetical protein